MVSILIIQVIQTLRIYKPSDECELWNKSEYMIWEIHQDDGYDFSPSPNAGTVICSSTTFSSSLNSTAGLVGWAVGVGVRSDEEYFSAPSVSGLGVSSVNAARSRSSTSATRLVFWPPRQINTAAKIPQRKLHGMRIPVLQAGRWNLLKIFDRCEIKKIIWAYRSRPHIVPHSITYK